MGLYQWCGAYLSTGYVFMMWYLISTALLYVTEWCARARVDSEMHRNEWPVFMNVSISVW
jgi:hypothetical protein